MFSPLPSASVAWYYSRHQADPGSNTSPGSLVSSASPRMPAPTQYTGQVFGLCCRPQSLLSHGTSWTSATQAAHVPRLCHPHFLARRAWDKPPSGDWWSLGGCLGQEVEHSSSAMAPVRELGARQQSSSICALVSSCLHGAEPCIRSCLGLCHREPMRVLKCFQGPL